MTKSVLIRMKYSGCNPFSDKLYQKYFARTLIAYNFVIFIMQIYYLSNYKVNYTDLSTIVLDVVGGCAVWQVFCIFF